MEKIITVDVGASKIKIQTIDKDGNVEKDDLTSLVGFELNNKNFAELLIQKVKTFLGPENKEIIAISIGIPGWAEQGIIKNMPNIPQVKELNIVEELKKEFDLTVFLLNDADAGALGELRLGAGRDYKNLVYLTLGTGLGSGVVVENKLQTKSELGHTPLQVESEERSCSCGKINCAESFLGTKGLAITYADIFGIKISDMSIEEQHSISRKMREGIASKDARWLKVLNKYANHLIIFLDNIILANNPEIIILGGGIAYDNKPLLRLLQEKIPNKIALAQFENSVNLGAAQYAFDNLGE